MQNNANKLAVALFSLRIGVFIVFFVWALDKLVNPDHAAVVYEKYYKIAGLGEAVSYTIGGLQMVLLAMFLLGIWKKWTTGVLFVFHLVSTLSTVPMLLKPWQPPNLLFYASFPMLFAIFALWLLRDEDTLFTVGGGSRR